MESMETMESDLNQDDSQDESETSQPEVQGVDNEEASRTFDG